MGSNYYMPNERKLVGQFSKGTDLRSIEELKELFMKSGLENSAALMVPRHYKAPYTLKCKIPTCSFKGMSKLYIMLHQNV